MIPHRALRILVLGLLLVPYVAGAYSSGPPDGYAGNPPYNENCTTCHFSYDPNSGDGSLEIVGLPDSYVPGQTYPLEVRLADPGQQRWGFEITVLDDAAFLIQGGQLVVTDPENTQISENVEGTEDYLKQTLQGTLWGIFDGPVGWSFDWIAPGPETDSVTFYLSGNAANGDEAFIGDYIYVISAPLAATPPTATVPSTWGRVKALYQR